MNGDSLYANSLSNIGVVLGVYILHSNPVFRDMFHWNGRWAGIVSCSPAVFLAKVWWITIYIFCVASLVDYFRLKVFALLKCYILNQLDKKVIVHDTETV